MAINAQTGVRFTMSSLTDSLFPKGAGPSRDIRAREGRKPGTSKVYTRPLSFGEYGIMGFVHFNDLGVPGTGQRDLGILVGRSEHGRIVLPPHARPQLCSAALKNGR